MPKYLISGRTERGREVTELVTAPSTDDAVRRFEARGYSDVTLHSDEVIGYLFKDGAIGEHLSPRDYLALGRTSRAGFVWKMTVKLYRQQWYVFVIAVLFLIGRRAMEVEWGVLDTFAVCYLCFPLFIVLIGELFSPSRKYERVTTFNAWGQWPEMLAALPSVRRFLPAQQYAFHEGKALAGMGRLDEAMVVVRPYADDRKTPAWLYWGQLADVFHAAKLGDRAIECLEKAVENAPDNATVLVDLTVSLLRYRRDTNGARALLARVRQLAISDLVRPFLVMADGILALEERRPELAKTKLEESLALAERMRNMSALVGAAIDRIHTYLCLACAAAGDSAAAEQHFRIAEPRLLAFESEDLLDRCRKACPAIG